MKATLLMKSTVLFTALSTFASAQAADPAYGSFVCRATLKEVRGDATVEATVTGEFGRGGSAVRAPVVLEIGNWSEAFRMGGRRISTLGSIDMTGHTHHGRFRMLFMGQDSTQNFLRVEVRDTEWLSDGVACEITNY